MTDSTRDMRHLPFFAELAALEDSDAAWRAASAGLVVLRLVDAWIEDGAAVTAADGWGIRSVRAAIEEIPHGRPVRAILTSVVNALEVARGGSMEAVAPRLMAYARSLDLDAKWALAADVYETVVAHVHPIEESDVAINALVRLSYCQRMLGDLDGAESIAVRAAQVATASDDLIGTLQARIAEAKVSIARGNYPRAERLLDDTIDRAARADLEPFRAHALQERAEVAFHRGEFEYSIKLGYEALDKLTDERNRDRMLNDIAGAFYKLGIRSAARDAYSLLALTAQEQYVRWIAAINLLEIAAADGSMPLFERQRRELDAASLPPLLRAQLLIHVGEGLARFGDVDGARRNLGEAVRFAEQYGYNRLVFDAEEKIALLMNDRHHASAEIPISEELAAIALDLKSRQRELASTR